MIEFKLVSRASRPWQDMAGMEKAELGLGDPRTAMLQFMAVLTPGWFV